MNYLSLVFLFILITQTTTTPTVRYEAINDECLVSYNIDAAEDGVENRVEDVAMDTQTSDFEVAFLLYPRANSNHHISRGICSFHLGIAQTLHDEKYARLMKKRKIPGGTKIHLGFYFDKTKSAWQMQKISDTWYTPQSDGVFSMKNPAWLDSIADDPCLMLQVEENFEDSRLVVESCSFETDYILCEAAISYALKLYKKSTASYEEARALCEENDSRLVVEAAKSDYAPIFDYFNLPPNSNLLLGYRWSDRNRAFENAETGKPFSESNEGIFSGVPEGSAGQCMFLQTSDETQDLKVITRQCDSSNNYVVCEKYRPDYEFKVHTTKNPLNYEQTLQYCKDQNEYMLTTSTINRHYFKLFEELNLPDTSIFLNFKYDASYFRYWGDDFYNPIKKESYKGSFLFDSYREGTKNERLALRVSSNFEDSRIIIVDKSDTFTTIVCQKSVVGQ